VQTLGIRRATIEALAILGLMLLNDNVPWEGSVDDLAWKYMVLSWKALNDDDETIREQAASSISAVLRDHNSDNPGFPASNLSNMGYAMAVKEWQPAFAKRLVCWSLEDFDSSDGEFQMEAVGEMTGGAKVVFEDVEKKSKVENGENGSASQPRNNDSNDNDDDDDDDKVNKPWKLMPAASVLFDQAVSQDADTQLFQVEKQNLYVDPVRESNIWKRVLKNMMPDGQLVANLAAWTVEGVRAVNAHLAKHGDGPLGFSSKPDAYAFLMKIINCAEIVFIAGKKDWVGSGGSALMNEMVKLYGLGAGTARGDWDEKGVGSKGLHPLVMERLEEILIKRATKKGLREAKRNIKRLAGQISL
jgi:hypothetical protein